MPRRLVMNTAAAPDAARSYWQQLDLTYLADTMCADTYPLPRWTRQDALHGIMLYKNFLWLHKLHPDAALVPTREIDECWHNHILHTRQYSEDCQQIFGRYFHHTPKQPGEDDTALARDYQLTQTLYNQTFGEPLRLIIDTPSPSPHQRTFDLSSPPP